MSRRMTSSSGRLAFGVYPSDRGSDRRVFGISFEPVVYRADTTADTVYLVFGALALPLRKTSPWRSTWLR